ncbi:MAG: hypothetical protein EOP05_10130 [Proteobacteria bacterium]|nr:MAG: hypothetical protein EOP05_10130 [Pseudomonadota bacterium]
MLRPSLLLTQEGLMVEQLGQPEILRVLNQVEIGFAVIELDGRVRFANEGFSRVCSRSLSDLYQGNIFVFDDGIEPSFKNSIADAFREGRQDRFVGETKVKDDSGAPKWVSFDANLIRDPKTGAPESQFLIVQDITARVLAELSASDLRRKAERKIQESEERFRTLAETIPQIVFSTDND